jgi:hypothetical protein
MLEPIKLSRLSVEINLFANYPNQKELSRNKIIYFRDLQKYAANN